MFRILALLLVPFSLALAQTITPASQLPSAPPKHPAEYYRYYSPEVQYLPLSDKGLSYAEVGREAPDFGSDEPIPRAQFLSTDANHPTDFPTTAVPVEILEEDGIKQNAPVRFGFPLPKGAIWTLDNLRILSPARAIVPCQKSITALWPDKSVRWCLLQFNAPLQPNERCEYLVEFGKEVMDQEQDFHPMLTENDEAVFIDTGILQANVSKNAFRLLENINVSGVPAGTFSKSGIRIVNENGTNADSEDTPPTIVRLEENGPQTATLLVEGNWGEAHVGKYSVRLFFHANSSIVDMEISYCNNELSHEFTDISSLAVSFTPSTPPNALFMEGTTIENGGRIFQQTDEILSVNDQMQKNRLHGLGTLQCTHGTFGFRLHDMWQRYPKAFSIADGSLNFELLPEQPSDKFGTDLPFYLQFPFCQGKYRFKWGIRFTEKLTMDFRGSGNSTELSARTVIPRISPDYLHEFSLVPGVLPKDDSTFREWDSQAISAFREHMQIKEKQREYGFLNYGDFFGERGINWTNNEYDFPHGLDMLFLRTGERDCYRWARIAAKHQADVDIIHAYPDPLYLGTQNQHAIAHTGAKKSKDATWAYFLNDNNWGNAGHTWSEGMLDSWLFEGDAGVMDSALEMSEHLVRYAAPMFKRLGTHERSAGWLIKAIMPFYKATGQKRYIDAATHVAEVALAEQKTNEGGAWPHLLPADHAGFYKREDTYGNCPFLINVLLEGLWALYDENHDPRIAKSIASGAKWLSNAFDNDQYAWPYAAQFDGRPCTKLRNDDNLLASSAMMFGGVLNDDLEIFEQCRDIMLCSTFIGANPYGNKISIDLSLTSNLMRAMMDFQQKHPETNPYVYSIQEVNAMLERRKQPQFRIRGPERKIFHVVLLKDNPTMKLLRLRHGNRPNPKPECSATVITQDGQILFKKTYSTNEIKREETISLKGRKDDMVTVEISDDLTGIWSILPNDSCAVYAEISEETIIGNANLLKYYITVPAKTEDFAVTVGAVHPGRFRAVLMRPDGTVAGDVRGENLGETRLPWCNFNVEDDPSLTINASASTQTKDECWALIIGFGNDISLNLSGIPKVISLQPIPFRQ